MPGAKVNAEIARIRGVPVGRDVISPPAHIEFTDRLGVPIDEGLPFVHNCLVGIGKRDQICIIASAKIVLSFDMMQKIALGADMCNMARPMMFAIGCIQAVRCYSNDCPTGVATQDPIRAKAVDVEFRKHHVARFHEATMESFLDLVGAMGLSSLEVLGPEHIYRRIGDETELPFNKLYNFLEPGGLLCEEIPIDYSEDWNNSSASSFTGISTP